MKASEFIKNRNKEIVKLYTSQKKTRFELCDMFYLDERNVSKILRMYNVKEFWDTKIYQRRKLFPIIIKEYKEGVDRKTLAKKYNLPEKTIYSCLRSNKIKLWDLQKKQRKKNKKKKKYGRYFDPVECWKNSIFSGYNT